MEITRKREPLKVPSFLLHILNLALIVDELTRLLDIKFEEEDFNDCYIYEITANTANKVVVYIDADSYLDFKKCQQISRYLEEFIDEKGWLGEKYTLDVSSPGIEKPLKFKRQYIKNIGRTINVKTIEDEELQGELKSVRDEDIVIEYKERIKEGNKKRTVVRTVPILLANIKKTTVEISFK